MLITLFLVYSIRIVLKFFKGVTLNNSIFISLLIISLIFKEQQINKTPAHPGRCPVKGKRVRRFKKVSVERNGCK